MTTLWYVGVLGVDRSRRELRVVVIRCYPGMPLVQSYSFFCEVLYHLFEDGGWLFQRSAYEENGTLDKAGETPEGLDYDFNGDAKKYIEHIEMLRWCGPDDYESERGNSAKLQAEYLVRVNDNKYISPRADPSFLGNFYYDTASYDKESDPHQVPMGPKQSTPICPVERFMVSHGRQANKYIQYCRQNLSTIDHFCKALPIFYQEDPAVFSLELLPKLPEDQQKCILAILAFAQRGNSAGVQKPTRCTRRSAKRAKAMQEQTVFSNLDRNVLYHIFSFLPLKDAVRAEKLHKTFLAMEVGSSAWFPNCTKMFFNALHEVSMKHFGIQNIIRNLSGQAEHTEQQLLELEGEEQERRLKEYVTSLEQIFQALDTVPRPLSHYFPHDPDYHGWVRKRHKIAKESSIRDLLESIANVPPHELSRLE